MRTANSRYRGLLAALAVSTTLAATFAAEAASLRQNPTVVDSMIRLGDLFTDVGDLAETIVMQAPAPGESEMLSSYELERIADQYELGWERPTYLKRINVKREGTPFALTDLVPLIEQAALDAGLTNDVQTRVFGSKRGLYLPIDASVEDITFERFNLNERMDRFTATVLVPTGDGSPRRLNLTGNLDEVRAVPMLNRIVTPGEIITEADITWSDYPAKRLNRAAILAPQSLIGQTVRRPVRPGHPVRANDVKPPVMVAKGSVVTMTITAGALTLTANGRALEDGGEGDTIRVMNMKSKQSIEAKVLRAGLVKVNSNILALAAR